MSNAKKKTVGHYMGIGRMIRERIESRYGKQWKTCLSREVARAIVASEAYYIVQSHHGEGTATDLVEHGRASLLAGFAACNLTEEPAL